MIWTRVLSMSVIFATIEKAQARIQGDNLGSPSPLCDKTDADQVAETILLAEADMRPVMDRLTWWTRRMAWTRRVDEISSIGGHALTRTRCQELEKKVSTGLFFTNIVIHNRATLHLAYSTYWSLINTSLQQSMTESAFALLSTHPNVPSAVLRSPLLQLKLERTTKISTHRDQILQQF
jgi:hypothetical protein